MDYANYQSGWCGNCGRRRGADGRCVNCDPWWTSPLVQVGGPLLAFTSLLLVVVAVSVPSGSSVASGPSSRPSVPLLAAPLVTPTAPLPGPLAPPPTFVASTPPVLPLALPVPQATPNPDVLQMEQLDALRYRVGLASRAMRERLAWQRTASRLSPRAVPTTLSEL